MPIDPIKTNAVNVAVTPDTTALSLASQLPRAALFSQDFQPLFQSVDPNQTFPFTPLPQPFSKAALSQVALDPSQLKNSLQTASTGLDSFVQSLDVAGADASVAQHMQNAQDAYNSGNMLQAQQEMMEAQKIQAFISQMLSIINQMEMDAIKASKLQ